MMAVAYLLFFCVYLLISLAVVAWIVIRAKKRGRNPWFWGLGALLVMYNLVFWDWLPSKVQHDYYCRNQAGFWVYKTLDQWKQENPGVFEMLGRNKGISKTIREGNESDYTDHYFLNDRFEWRVSGRKIDFCGIDVGLGFRQEILIDRSSKEQLAKYTDFGIGPGLGSGGLRIWKVQNHCNSGEKNMKNFSDYLQSIQGEKK